MAALSPSSVVALSGHAPAQVCRLGAQSAEDLAPSCAALVGSPEPSPGPSSGGVYGFFSMMERDVGCDPSRERPDQRADGVGSQRLMIPSA